MRDHKNRKIKPYGIKTYFIPGNINFFYLKPLT